jgi:hypothetical protein
VRRQSVKDTSANAGFAHSSGARKEEQMLRLKACPRCRGDLVIVVTLDGRSATCLQRGYAAELRPAGVPAVVLTGD